MRKLFSVIVTCVIMFGLIGCMDGSSSKIEKKQVVSLLMKVDNDEPLVNKVLDVSKIVEDVTSKVKISLKPKVVVIDPGHGKNGNKGMERISPESEELKIKDPGGAQGCTTGVPEYKVNLQVAMKLKEKLEANNIKVVMTKIDDNEDPGNIERAETANNINGDLEIRIHCDSAENQAANGASMLVPGDTGYAKGISKVSERYGKIILENFVKSAGMNNRGISVRNDLTGFNWSKVPIVLVEMGFMSNSEEDMKLGSDEYQEKLAEGLCNGIIEALNS